MLVFTALYSLISLLNHYLVRTETLDLGVFNNAIWDYSHFKFNYGECLNKHRNNFLHDHFDLYLIMFSPLSHIFRSYTLLVVQIAAVVFGGLGVYRIAIKLHDDRWIASLAMIVFYSFFGVYGAIAFDYHSNVIAAMILPWFFYFLIQRKWKWVWVTLVLILIGKENMALWMFFVCIGAFLFYFRQKEVRRPLVLMALFSVVYFVLVVQFVMPSLSPAGAYVHFKYSVLGDSMSDALINLIKRPFHYLQYLWENQRPDGKGAGLKEEFWLFFSMSGGILLLLRPAFIIMLVPVFLQKFYNDRTSLWGINYQYCIEFTPILAIGALYVVQMFSQRRIKRVVMGVLAIACCITTFQALESSLGGPKNDKAQFYSKLHYVPKHDVAAIKKVLEMIPEEASVSGSSRLVAQLSFRDHAFRLPMTSEADYFVHCWDFSTYPLPRDGFARLVDDLKASGEWKVVVDDGYMLLLKRITAN